VQQTACVLSQHLLGRNEKNHTNPHLERPITQPRFKTSISETQVYSSTVTPTHLVSLNWINQQDAATSQVYYLSFRYSSTCFGHHRAHHQELQLQ